MSTVHNGKCFCGSVEFELSGDPEFMGYCHCGIVSGMVRRSHPCGDDLAS